MGSAFFFKYSATFSGCVSPLGCKRRFSEFNTNILNGCCLHSFKLFQILFLRFLILSSLFLWFSEVPKWHIVLFNFLILYFSFESIFQSLIWHCTLCLFSHKSIKVKPANSKCSSSNDPEVSTLSSNHSSFLHMSNWNIWIHIHPDGKLTIPREECFIEKGHHELKKIHPELLVTEGKAGYFKIMAFHIGEFFWAHSLGWERPWREDWWRYFGKEFHFLLGILMPSIS